VRTELGKYLFLGWKKIIKLILYPLWWIFTKSSFEGAQTTVYCVMQSEDRLKNGGYYADCKLDSVTSFAENPENQLLLWERS